MSRLESRPVSEVDKKQIESKEELKTWNAFDKQIALKAFDNDLSQVDPVKLDQQLDGLFQNAKALMQAGEHQLAKRVFLGLIQKEPRFDPAYEALIQCFYSLGEVDKILEYLEIRTQVYPSFSSYFALAEELFGRNQADNAEICYFEALKYPHIESPALFNLYKNLGSIALRKKDYSAAEESYSKAYTIDDQNDILLVNFGSLAIHRGQLDRAVTCFRQAVELNHRNPKAWVGLGMIHREFGDYELSWANIEKALDFDPSNETAAKLVADWGLKDNEIERTLRLLTSYAKHRPNDAFNEMVIAKYYYLIGNIGDAKLHIDNAIELNSDLEDVKDLYAIISEEHERIGL